KGIAITPDGTTVYVTNEFLTNGTVTPITVATNTPGIPIPAGNSPEAIAITPDGTTAYVTNRDDATATPITLATATPSTPLPPPRTSDPRSRPPPPPTPPPPTSPTAQTTR